MPENPVFILMATPRCGSTWLQRCFNSTGVIMLWGEHNLVARLNQTDEPFPGDTLWTEGGENDENDLDKFLNEANRWSASTLPRLSAMNAGFKAFYEFAFDPRPAGCLRWGFKVSGWDMNYLEFLLNSWDRSRVIFLTRKLFSAYQSAFSSKNREGREDFIANWCDKNRRIKWYQKHYGNHRLKVVQYEHLLRYKRQYLPALFRWCSLPPPKPSVVNSWISTPPLYDPFTGEDLDLFEAYRNRILEACEAVRYDFEPPSKLD